MTVPYFPPVMLYCMADLSHWDPLADSNTAADFAAARAFGITHLALKATQGTGFVDPTFVERRAAASEAGIALCAYAFLDASASGTAQAAWLLQTLGPLDGIELALDCEANGASSVSIAMADEAAQAIEDAVGFAPIYYGTRFGPDGMAGGLPNATLSRCPLWLAEWGNQPICPAGWDAWRIWQCTDGTDGRDVAPVPGLGVVDRSYIAARSLGEIDTWWGKR